MDHILKRKSFTERVGKKIEENLHNPELGKEFLDLTLKKYDA